MVWRIGVERIDAGDALEGIRVLLEDAGEEAVVVAVVDHLDDDGASDPIGFHLFEERFGRGVARGTLAPGAKGKAGSCFQTWTWGSMTR